MCVKRSDGKEFRFSLLMSPFLQIESRGAEGMWRSSAQRSSSPHPRKTYLLCIRSGPRCGLDLSSAKKQTATCEDYRRSYSLHGHMQVCDLDRHSVKGPGVDATYHVPSAEAPASSCDLNVLSQLVPTLLRSVSHVPALHGRVRLDSLFLL